MVHFTAAVYTQRPIVVTGQSVSNPKAPDVIVGGASPPVHVVQVVDHIHFRR